MAVSMRLAASLRRGLYAAITLLFASGAAWLLVRDMVAPDRLPDDLAATAMRVHGAAAMAMLVLTGGAIALHVPAAWRERRNRVSGLAFSSVLIVIVVTGYVLYYFGNETLRSAASAGHWLLGLALPAAFACHAWLGRQNRPRETAVSD
jgi:hypothetical protein